MGTALFITENWLAENATLSAGGEVHLPAESRLTPAARDVLNARLPRAQHRRPGRATAALAAADRGG